MKKFHIEKLKDISSKEKMEKKQLFYLHENSSNSIVSKSISLDSFEANNNSKYSSNNPSTQSEINSDNYADNKLIFDNKDTNEGNNKFNLLRKKTKITFNITKRTKKKIKFFTTTKYFKNTNNLFFGKDHNKNIQKICQKKKLFQTNKYFYRDNSIENINGGRWSYEEHIKFIESFVNYGKNWKTIQKYVGTRSYKQIISHAQKFLLRLKELNTDKYCFNLRKNNIKSLSDVINLISRNNKTNKSNKEYLIDILIALSELNLENKGRKYFEPKKDNLIIRIKKEEEEYDKISKTNDESLNKIDSNNKNFELDDFISGIDLIEDEDEDIIPNKESNLDEIYINNNNLFVVKENNIYKNSDKIIHGYNYNSNYNYIDNSIKQNFIDNNSSLLLSDCSRVSSIDNLSNEPMNNVLKKILNRIF